MKHRDYHQERSASPDATSSVELSRPFYQQEPKFEKHPLTYGLRVVHTCCLSKGHISLPSEPRLTWSLFTKPQMPAATSQANRITRQVKN